MTLVQMGMRDILDLEETRATKATPVEMVIMVPTVGRAAEVVKVTPETTEIEVRKGQTEPRVCQELTDVLEALVNKGIEVMSVLVEHKEIAVATGLTVEMALMV